MNLIPTNEHAKCLVNAATGEVVAFRGIAPNE